MEQCLTWNVPIWRFKKVRIPLRPVKYTVTVLKKVTISSTEARFLSDYLEAIASKALYLADKFATKKMSVQ